MNKKLIKWQLRTWLPELAIMFAIFAVVLLPIYLNMHVAYVSHNVDADAQIIINSAPTVGIINTLALVFANLSSVFVYQYRYKKKKVDTFYQLPLRKNELKNTRIILALICQIVIITFFYWLCVAILGIKQGVELAEIAKDYPELSQEGLLTYNYGFFAIYYFVLIAYTSCIYFISCFFASLANHTQTALCNVILFNLITELCLFSLSTFVMKFTEYDTYAYISFLNCSPSSLGIGNAIYYLFMHHIDPHYIMVYNALLENGTFMGRLISTMVEVAVFGIASAFYCLYIKDPSGENAGSIKCRYKWAEYLPHVFGFLVSVVLGISLCTTYFWMLLLVIPFYFIIYYTVLCLMRKTFRLPIRDFILIGVFFVMAFILANIPYPN